MWNFPFNVQCKILAINQNQIIKTLRYKDQVIISLKDGSLLTLNYDFTYSIASLLDPIKTLGHQSLTITPSGLSVFLFASF